MKKKDILLDFLKKQSSEKYISATQLGEILGVTERSIRYYVKQINETFNDILESSHEGYRFNKNTKNQESIKIAGNAENRRLLILRRLLKVGDRGLNLFDLSTQLYISEATIRGDFFKLQSMVKKYQLSINQVDFFYFLIGEDRSKRDLMNDLIQKYRKGPSLITDEMQRFLDDISLADLSQICQSVFSRYDFKVNNYFFQNFMLHLVFAINQHITGNNFVYKSNSLEMIEEVSLKIFEKYSVELSLEDKRELALLCDGENQQNVSWVENYIQSNASKSLNRALKELSATFPFNFTDQKFLIRLYLHTQSLYNRAKEKKIKRNLSTVDIKISYPALFDVAVYLSSLISEDLQIEIVEDEIAFLALHLGFFLDEHKKNSHKIRAMLDAPTYIGRSEVMRDILEKKFGDDLIFSETNDFELLISTDKRNDLTTFFEKVKISEFLTERDFNLVHQAIENIKKRRYLNFLEDFLPQLIQADFCINIENYASKEEVFKVIGDWFVSRGFAELGYTNKLLEREKMASTVFASGVAIPHTIKYEANETKAMIVKPDGEFSWDGQKVSLVFAIAVSQRDFSRINRIFQRIIELLVDDYNVSYLKGSSTREIFISRLIELMTSDGYYEQW